jgi:hypothetical protein
MHKFEDSEELLGLCSMEVSKTFMYLTKISSFHSNEYGDWNCGK